MKRSGYTVFLALIVMAAPALAQNSVSDSEAAGQLADEIRSEVEQSAQAGQQEGEPEVDEQLPPPGEAQERRLTLMVSGNVNGNFARVNCRSQDGHQELYWAKHAAYYQALSELAEGTELAAPLSLNVGNSLFPGSLGRYLATQQEEGAQRLAEIVAQVPTDVHGVGNREFSVPRSVLTSFAEAMEERDVDMQAANLTCADFGGAEAICDAVRTGDDMAYRVVERDGVRMAVTTVLSPELLDRLALAQRQGVEIVDPAEVLKPLIEEMREEADLVIVQHQVPSRQASEMTYELASQVEGIDLLIASHLIEAPTTGGVFDPEEPTAGGRMEVIEAANTGTPIVSGNSAQYGAINIELDTVRSSDEGDDSWAIRRVIPRRVLLENLAPHAETSQVLKSAVDDFCGDWGDPIGEHARLDEPFEMDDLQRFVLNVMRFASRSEVSLVNRRSFRNEQQFPLTDHLTQADIYTALPFENELVTASISGATLRGLVGKLGADVLGTGITVVDGAVRINGRTPQPDRNYRVALNDFLAEGGDGVFGADDLTNVDVYHPPWSEEPPSIGEIAVDYVETGQHLRRGEVDDAVSADDNFPDLHRKFLWSFLGSLNTSYNQVAVNNPDAEQYEQSQLVVQSTDQINFDGRLAAEADSRNHGWNNSLAVNFATARISDAEDTGFEETKDEIRLRSRYRYKRLRADQDFAWYVPDPVVEGQAESEFSSPETRDWHRLNLRAIAGASFQLFEPLDVRLGVNVSQDVLEPGGRATTGVNASYTLSRVSPLRLMDRPIRFESEVEYFYNDIGNQNIHEARSRNRVFFAVFEEFFFTTTFNAFLYQDDSVGELGTNTELTIGINYEWERALQNF